EIMPEELGRTREPEVPLWGDAREGVRDLLTALSGDAAATRERQADYAGDVGRRMRDWRESVRERLESDETPVAMARLMHELNVALPDDGILVADGGFAAHWGGLLYDTKQA